jgi:hypothetical protein
MSQFLPSRRLATLFNPSEQTRHGRALATLAVLAAAGAVASCGDEPGSSPTQPKTTTQREQTAEQPPEPDLKPPPCPPELSNCRRASGTILYVERVDPDGDGDAHFVLLSAESITAPGVSVIDVRRDLRPHPLPGPGEQLAAAGPMFPGSHDQLQIQAEAVRTAKP